MKSIWDVISYAILSLLWTGISIYTMTLNSKNWIMLIFTVVPLIFMAFEIHEYRISRKYYKKYLQEERMKLGLTDKVVETEDTEPEEEEEYDERDAEIIRQAEEFGALEEYDADSGKGYCPHCGNYGVNSDKICESCGEKVTE